MISDKECSKMAAIHRAILKKLDEAGIKKLADGLYDAFERGIIDREQGNEDDQYYVAPLWTNEKVSHLPDNQPPFTFMKPQRINRFEKLSDDDMVYLKWLHRQMYEAGRRGGAVDENSD